MYWLKVNVSNNGEKQIPYHTRFFLNAIQFLGIYIKYSNKKQFFNPKYIAKKSNPITKPQFLAIIKLTYTEIK